MTQDTDRIWERWTEVDRLFSAALEQPPTKRLAFLESACGDDRELIELVSDLLRTEKVSEGHFEAPEISTSRDFIDNLADQEDQARQIGPYSIVRELGRGGMGSVFLAEHEGEGFTRQVAIKVLRRGVDTDDILRRFVTERRILASLSHPNIARLYDGGATETGQPYLVMELVEGESLTSYCDHRRLDLRERLKLILQVVDAVQAAHTRLIVHRDLKPSNILVDSEGQVKLLDFGIAKLLGEDEGSRLTKTGSYVLTPDHASPEQLRGEPATTATDVYQLGLLLFQLVSGQTPYRPGRSIAARLAELAQTAEVPRPSAAFSASEKPEHAARLRSTTAGQLRRTLLGDLDTIVCKSLQVEPERRYSSVEQLGADIRRYLKGSPISARPDTLGYRARMFARRNPWAAVIGLLTTAFAALYTVTQMRHTRELEAERNAAQVEAARAQEVQRFLVDLFSSANPYSPADSRLGSKITVVEALDLGAERLETALKERPAPRASILSSISNVYEDLGAYSRAFPLRQEAYELQVSLYGSTSRQARDSLANLANLRAELGELDVATELHERRLELALAADPQDPAEIADARTRLAAHLFRIARAVDAEPHLIRATELADSEEVPTVTLVESTRVLADVQRALSRLDDSERTARRAVELASEKLGPSSAAAALAHATLAATLSSMGRFEESDAQFEEAIGGLERTLGADHGHRLETLANQAVLRVKAGDFSGAEDILGQLVMVGERVYGEDHPAVGDYLQNYATALVGLGQLNQARPIYERVAKIFRDNLASDNYERALPLLSLAEIHLEQDRPLEAEATAREAYDVLRTTLPEGHFITAIAACRLGRSLIDLGRADEAGPYLDLSTGPLLETSRYPDYRRECLTAAADLHEARGNPDQARELREAVSR